MNPAIMEQGDLLWKDVPSVMKTNIPLTDDPAQEDLLWRNRERIEKLSQQD